MNGDMTETSAEKSKTTTLSDLLEGPFDLIAYGELFKGFKVAYDQLSERMKKRIRQIMVDHDIALYPSHPTQVGQWNDDFREKYNEFARPGLATIHGYRHGGTVTVLSDRAANNRRRINR